MDQVYRSFNLLCRIHGPRKPAGRGGGASSIIEDAAGGRATRDLCTVVKANAIPNGTATLGESRFSREFETCAARTLHYEASLMQAGGIIGVDNILKTTKADFCGVNRLAVGRAMLKSALESGRTIPRHDTAPDNIDSHLDECAASGKFALSDAVWNEYANRAIVLPFYDAKAARPR